MKTAILAVVVLVPCLSGCATRSLTVEIRTRNNAPAVQRIHFVEADSIGSSELAPKPVRQEGEFKYYSYHGLIAGAGRRFVVVDLDSGNESEIYNLPRIGVGQQTEWLDPDYRATTDNGRHVTMRLLHGTQPLSNSTNQTAATTQMRYQSKDFNY